MKDYPKLFCLEVSREALVGVRENVTVAGGWRIRGGLGLHLLANIPTGAFFCIIYFLVFYYLLHICPAIPPLLFEGWC